MMLVGLFVCFAALRCVCLLFEFCFLLGYGGCCVVYVSRFVGYDCLC